MLERRRSRRSTKLQNGGLDIVISTSKLPDTKCKTQVPCSERVLIALPEDHRLADRDIVYWTDLRTETLLMSQYDPYWEFEDLVISKLVSHDDRPKLERHG
jgi:DNA-binding transcriptional LysR family regulator